MAEENPTREYIVFGIDRYTREQQKQGGNPANAIIGIVRAGDEAAAQDTAAAVSPDKTVFIRELSSAPDAYVAAAKKMGYLNTSEAHPYL